MSTINFVFSLSLRLYLLRLLLPILIYSSELYSVQSPFFSFFITDKRTNKEEKKNILFFSIYIYIYNIYLTLRRNIIKSDQLNYIINKLLNLTFLNRIK
jgi:hypothetical protein